ncbi:hypothetical protein NQZ68_015955 [Dissostichus eleginoides]|nr:hypothetical protein NQZ68_015955 [Dissostichus eleginoides]
MTAHKGWTTYANVRLLITCDSLEKAKRYEEKYVNTGCPTTDLSSEDEAGERGKRRVRPNPVYMESDGESETSCVKRRFAKPPDVHCPTVLPESSQYPSVPTPNASSAFGGSHSEDVLSIHQADNGFCGSYLAELDQSMDHCNDDIAAMRTTKMLTELCMEVKQISRDINFIKTELAKLNIHGAGPESQEDNFPIMLPLTNEEKFDETEAALREEAARRKMEAAADAIFPTSHRIAQQADLRPLTMKNPLYWAVLLGMAVLLMEQAAWLFVEESTGGKKAAPHN